mmetsp:Transcript_17808/g.29273  ORF Transcript_17808/g.29273 Transcript_17808/m.29273 type:complete len:329 (+) Transcript_17808:38-1024(+)
MDDVGAKNVLERLESLGVLKEVSCLLELEMQAESDIADISTSPGPIQEMQALNDTIRNLLKRAARLLEKLDNSAEETERDSDAAFLLAEADFHRERIETLQKQLRSANLLYKDRQEENRRREREALLAGGEQVLLQRRTTQSREAVLRKAHDVTESMRRTRQLMASSIDRANSTLASMDEQSELLRRTHAEHRVMGSAVAMTRNLISNLNKRHVMDRMLVTSAFALFLFVVLSIMGRRTGLRLPHWTLLMQSSSLEQQPDGSLLLKTNILRVGIADDSSQIIEKESVQSVSRLERSNTKHSHVTGAGTCIRQHSWIVYTEMCMTAEAA